PYAAAVASAAIDLLETDDGLTARLHARIAQFTAACAAAGVAIAPSPTAIQPFILGAADAALASSRRLLDAGFLVPAIRPPTVPEGTSRLRISLCATHAAEDVASLAAALARCRGR